MREFKKLSQEAADVFMPYKAMVGFYIFIGFDLSIFFIAWFLDKESPIYHHYPSLFISVICFAFAFFLFRRVLFIVFKIKDRDEAEKVMIMNKLYSISALNISEAEKLNNDFDLCRDYGDFSFEELNIEDKLRNVSVSSDDIKTLKYNLIPKYLGESRDKFYEEAELKSVSDFEDDFHFFSSIISEYIKFSIFEIRYMNLEKFSKDKDVELNSLYDSDKVSYSFIFSMLFGLCKYWRGNSKSPGLVKFQNLIDDFYYSFNPRVLKEYSIDDFCKIFAEFVLTDRGSITDVDYMKKINCLFDLEEFVKFRANVRRCIFNIYYYGSWVTICLLIYLKL